MDTGNYHESNIKTLVSDFLNKKINYDYPEENLSNHLQKKELIENIKYTFIEYTKRYKEIPDSLIIIRWFYTQKLFDTTGIDALLPYNNDLNEGLRYEMDKYNTPIDEIIELSNILKNIISRYRPIVNEDILLKSYFKDGNYFYFLKREPIIHKFILDDSSYNKLKDLYVPEDNKFEIRLLALLCRYHSLSAPGYHAGIPLELFSLLRSKLKVNHEIFASPFNCNLELNSYSSAYPDTDKFFGSKGNFFGIYKELFKNGGSFEANPPFLEEHMTALTFIILTELKKNKNPLSFVVVYPSWTDAMSYTLLLESEYNVLLDKVLIFDKYKHHYTQSSQYWHKLGVDKNSGSGSSIFILQNSSGKQKYGVTNEIIVDIIDKFTNKR